MPSLSEIPTREIMNKFCEIEDLLKDSFDESVKVTLFIRNPKYPEGKWDGLLTTEDGIPDIIEALKRKEEGNIYYNLIEKYKQP